MRFLRFLIEVTRKYGFNHIDIECTNAKSGAFAKKLGFRPTDGENFTIVANDLINYFSIE